MPKFLPLFLPTNIWGVCEMVLLVLGEGVGVVGWSEEYDGGAHSPSTSSQKRLQSACVDECSLFRTTVPDQLLSLIGNSSYNPHAIPTYGQNRPTKVEISMYIEGISSFKPQSMTRDAFDRIWHPDLYFANAKTSSFHDVTSPNFLVFIHQNGTVYYDCRISMKVMCMMDLSKYPLDTQRCHIRILSYAYDIEQVEITWKNESAIEKNPDIKLADMNLNSILPGYCNGTYTLGTWSCITANFTVQREIMHHILQNYIPTTLIVVISWFSFWLDIDAVPGRVSLCITTLLTLATQASGARISLPQVSYIKAIDVWMGMCLAFVFGVMIEFTIVNYWARRKCGPKPLDDLDHHKPSTRSHSSHPLVDHPPPQFHNLKPLDSHMHPRPSPELDLSSRGENCSPSKGETAPLVIENTSRSRQKLKSTLDIWQRHTSGVSNGTSLIRRMNPRSSTATSLSDHEYADSTSAEGGGKGRWQVTLKGLKHMKKSKYRKTAQSIDQRCRVAFPLSFLILNILYWTYYLFIA